jgi:uncharacterized protein YndB with AHSA1/START domain
MVYASGSVNTAHGAAMPRNTCSPSGTKPVLVSPATAPALRVYLQASPALSQPRERPKQQEALVVRRETHVPAPPAAVFALLTDPEKILRWMGTEANVEPQPGGIYFVNVTGARCARGSFREVVPVHRLAYSFGWEGSDVMPPGSSLIEIDLLEQPDGTLLAPHAHRHSQCRALR